MSAKHRKASKLAAKRTAIAATAIGATASIGLMGAPAQAATVTPNYTQIISDYSHAYDNFLLGAGNLGGAAGNAWNPIASQVPLGLLPTFTADTTQADLTSITGILTALGQVGQIQIPDNIPGLPSGNTIPGIGSIPGVSDLVDPALGAVSGIAAVVGPVLEGLESIQNDPLLGGLLTGIPALSEIITGLEATSTLYNSSYSWLGMDGSTSASNLFLTIPKLTAAKIVTDITSNLEIGGIKLGDLPGGVPSLLEGVLAPLDDLVNTPTITAWVPSAGGLYDLPLGGSTGWFATMPTLAIGPVAAGPLGLSSTDTVVAIPIGGFGLSAPLDLFQTGFINTPGVVLPTATGVTTVGGTTIGQFNIPMLPTPALYANTLRSSYFGTNGFHVNSGQTALTLPGIPVPIVYSMGSFNAGTTGMGFTLPSLFGVGLVPSFQIGTAPGQTSPDGLIPASVLNLVGPRLLPTQLTSVTELLGLPDFMGQTGTALTPIYTGLVTPLITPISDFATQQYGPFLNGTASGILDLSERFKNISGQAAEALPSAPQTALAASPTEDNSQSTVTKQKDVPAITALSSEQGEPGDAPKPPVSDAGSTDDGTGDQTPEPAQSGGKHREGTPVQKIADRIQNTGDKITTGIDKVGDKVSDGIDTITGNDDGSTDQNQGADTTDATDNTVPADDSADASGDEANGDDAEGGDVGSADAGESGTTDGGAESGSTENAGAE